jgi:hypothetical protein
MVGGLIDDLEQIFGRVPGHFVLQKYPKVHQFREFDQVLHALFHVLEALRWCPTLMGFLDEAGPSTDIFDH